MTDPPERRTRALPLLATVAALVPEAYGLLPGPKRFDCPKCRRAELQRGATLIYCLRCAYTEKP